MATKVGRRMPVDSGSRRLLPSAPASLTAALPDTSTELAKALLQSQGYTVEKSNKNRSFPGFLKAILRKDVNTLEKVYGSGYVTDSGPTVYKAAMGENTGLAGGYLVPTDYTTKLLNVFAEESFIFPRANIWPMASATTRCPMVDVETAQATGTSPFFGGLNFGWADNDNIPETEPAFRMLTLKAWNLIGYAIYSNQLLEDIQPEGEEALLNLFGKAAAWQAEYAFLRGLGAANYMPDGILNAGATVSVSRTGSNTIVVADIANMAAKIIPYSWIHGFWAAHPSCLAQIAKISQYFINGDWSYDGACGYLMTKPLFITEKLPALGSAGDLIFMDPSLYVIGQRSEILIDVSPHYAFQTNQTYFRIWLRIDGRPQLSSSVTLADGSTASAYVKLAA